MRLPDEESRALLMLVAFLDLLLVAKLAAIEDLRRALGAHSGTIHRLAAASARVMSKSIFPPTRLRPKRTRPKGRRAEKRRPMVSAAPLGSHGGRLSARHTHSYLCATALRAT